MKFYFKTLGCRLNQAESEQIIQKLEKVGFNCIKNRNKADFCIINTCSVTHKADRESRKEAKIIRKRNPNAKIIVTGCSRVDIEEVDIFIKEKEKVVNKINNIFKSNKFKKGSNKLSEREKRTRALIKIQEGCNKFCTYCIIPYIRGGPRSISSFMIISEINKKVKSGYKEVVLTGVNIGKYKDDESDVDLVGLINNIITNTNIERIRLSSINPEDISEEFISLFKNKRLCQHLHLSLQSGSDTVLRRMGRNYSTKQYYRIINKLYKKYPLFGVTTDIIVGFPGETEKEFMETCKFFKKVNLLKVHIFRYSKRKGTKAEKMAQQISETIKKKRAKILKNICKISKQKYYEKIMGKKVAVLFENKLKKNIWTGYSTNYIKVFDNKSGDLTNTIKDVKISKNNIAI